MVRVDGNGNGEGCEENEIPLPSTKDEGEEQTEKVLAFLASFEEKYPRLVQHYVLSNNETLLIICEILIMRCCNKVVVGLHYLNLITIHSSILFQDSLTLIP